MPESDGAAEGGQQEGLGHEGEGPDLSVRRAEGDDPDLTFRGSSTSQSCCLTSFLPIS